MVGVREIHGSADEQQAVSLCVQAKRNGIRPELGKIVTFTTSGGGTIAPRDGECPALTAGCRGPVYRAGRSG